MAPGPADVPSLPVIAACAAGSAYVLPYIPSLATWSRLALFALIFSSFAFVRATYTVVIWPKLLSPLRHLPQAPGGSFFNGQVWKISPLDVGMTHRKWINEVPNHGLIRYLMVGNNEHVMLTSPKAIGEALVTKSYDFKKPAFLRDILGDLLGIGILLAEGDEHRTQRKHLMPAFAYRHVKDLVPTFWSLSSKFVKVVTEEVQSKALQSADGSSAVVEFHTWINRATLDIIGAAGLGFDFGAIDDENSELSVIYRRVFAPSGQQQALDVIGNFIPWWFLNYLPIPRLFHVRRAAKQIRDISRTLIERKQREIREKGMTGHKDILSVALGSNQFTVDNLVDQTMTFLAAGHETTATATQWAMVVLSQHPDIQARLRAEVRAVLPSPDSDVLVTAELLGKAPYLHAFCQEMLRFWPPVPFSQRVAARDTTVQGVRIPKGASVVPAPYAVNFSKQLWGEDADKFDPERWMGPGRANTGGAESAYSNMTFLHGPRSCIGSAFAKHEFECLVAAIVGRFEIELVPKDRTVELYNSIVTRPKGGIPLRMKVAEGW